MSFDSVSRPCPLCGSIDEATVLRLANLDATMLTEHSFASRKIPEYMHYRLIVCPVCDLLYASPVPPAEQLARAYRDAAFDSQEEAHFASRTYAKFLPLLVDSLPGLVGAMDIGTGDGAFLKELIAAGFTNVQGVEPSAAPIAAASPQIRALIKHSVFHLEDFEPSNFCLITCFQTVEHLSDPLATCRDALILLKPGGALFIIGHNWRAFSTKLLGRRSPIFDIEHMQLLSARSVRYMLERAGFINVRLDRVVNCYPLHYWVKLFPIPRTLKGRLISVLKTLKIGFVPLSFPAGNLAAIAFKPGAIARSPGV